MNHKDINWCWWGPVNWHNNHLNWFAYLYSNNFQNCVHSDLFLDLGSCLQWGQHHLLCYCSHNELLTHLYLYPSYQELVCHHVLNEFHSLILYVKFSQCHHLWISSIFPFKLPIFKWSIFTPPEIWNRLDLMAFCGKMFLLSLFISFSSCSDTWIWTSCVVDYM